MSSDAGVKDEAISLMRSTSLTDEQSFLNNENLEQIAKNKSNLTNMNIFGDSCSYCWSMMTVSVLLTLYILFKIRNPLQYYVKYLVYIMIVMVYALCIIPFTIFRPNNTKNIEYAYLIYFILSIAKIN